MKKPGAWLLLLVILFHMGLFYPLFFFRKTEIKREVRNRIMQGDGQQFLNKAIVLVLSCKEFNNLQWVEKNREFILNGRMFDIISIQTDLHGIRIVALEDGKEWALFQALKKREDNRSSKSGLVNAGMQFSIYCLPHHPPLLPIPCRALVLCGFRENNHNLFYPGVPSPPPRIA